MIRRLLRSLGLISVLFFSFAPAAGAYNPLDAACTSGSNTSAVCQDKGSGDSGNVVVDTIQKAAKIVAVLAGIAAVILIIIAGINYILSGGDSAKVTNAKNTIIYALVGLLVIALAASIISFVIGKL